MRDPKRLNDFYNELCKIHKEKYTDWRFGQLMCNFIGWYYEKYLRDIFYLEEEDFIEKFKEFAHEC